MKKLSMSSVALAFLAGVTLVGCSTSADDAAGMANDNLPKLKFTTRSGDATEASYAHKAFLIAEGNISDAKSAANAVGLSAFSVEPGTYTIYATAANDEANLTFSGVAATNPIANAQIKVTDMSAQIPELLIGKSAATAVGETGATANIELKRVVSSVDVTVNGLENVDAATITLTIGNMYDAVDMEGNLAKSGADFASKVITLTKNTTTGKFTGNAIVMPTDTEAAKLALIYTINGIDYPSTPTAKIEANKPVELTTTVTNGSTPTLVNMSSSVSYKAWDTTVSLSDSFTIGDTTPDKTWTSAALLIGGTDNGRDNFWASSDNSANNWGDTAGESFETYNASNLYDGIKDDGRKYWTPADWDRTAPIWYLNLGAACQGVTIDYWNKAGGKGGQKINTMDIYGSNTKGDYSGGNTNWVKIKTFTSDKITPTTDAGVQVTTGKIAFSEDGATSYQYIKCVVTSKVNPDGVVVKDVIDVNVGELEVTTWSYK